MALTDVVFCEIKKSEYSEFNENVDNYVDFGEKPQKSGEIYYRNNVNGHDLAIDI